MVDGAIALKVLVFVAFVLYTAWLIHYSRAVLRLLKEMEHTRERINKLQREIEEQRSKARSNSGIGFGEF